MKLRLTKSRRANPRRKPTDLPSPPTRDRTVDARLHVLDHLVVDIDDKPVAVVDDLELTGIETGTDIDPDAPPPRVDAILSGNALPTRIFGGRPPDSRLDRLEWNDVDRIGVCVHLSVEGARLDHLWVERWTADRVIGRIPGARHAAE
ncbi:hypothetical protein [Rhodococcus chondri]|uniref:Uncharacterized protein n=1 Tax=Rhodococcus chondri TaxID=3065941 RepID=A0ABU7JWU6_9NOCA|nr:hypothetical protein [Rhodococcus sp. CC-R104]MEE2034491.1 hypothetical protein [Rhodococcus sp. CC-R104]